MNANWTGKTLDNRYVLERTLGTGATATVYEALDTQLQRRVAVKLLHPRWAGDPLALAGFQHVGGVGNVSRERLGNHDGRVDFRFVH